MATRTHVSVGSRMHALAAPPDGLSANGSSTIMAIETRLATPFLQVAEDLNAFPSPTGGTGRIPDGMADGALPATDPVGMSAALAPAAHASDLQAVAPAVLSESEPNNTRSSADSVPLGATIAAALSTGSDLDVFSVMFPAAGTVTLMFDAPTSSSDDYFRVGLHDGSGMPLAIFDTGSDGAVTVGVIKPGTYYVVVSPGDHYDAGQYTLTATHMAGPTTGFESEPNGYAAVADSLALGSPITGQLYSLLDIDVFGVEVAAAGALTVNFDAPTSSSDAYFKLGLYDSSGTVLAQFETGHDETFTVGAPEAGGYYVAVWSSTYYDSGQYVLTVTTAAGGSGEFESEPNGSFATADEATLGLPIKGQLATDSDLDLFSVVLAGPGSLTLTIDVSTDVDDDYFLLGLYESSGLLLSQFATGRDGTYTVGAPAAGKYYVGVSAATSYDAGQYSLTVTPAPGAVAGFESEPNDAAESADVVPLRTVVKGQLYDGTDVDWFSFALASPGTVTLGFDAPTSASRSYFALEIDDIAGTPLASFSTGQDQTFVFAAPAAGTYFVRVGPASNYDSGQYGLTVTPMFNAVTGTDIADVIDGTPGADWITALAGNDIVNGHGGNDVVDGGDGVDTLVLNVTTADVLAHPGLVFSPGLLSQVGASIGVVEVTSIERVRLTDGLYAFDTLAPTESDPGGKVWQAAALYRAGFGQMPEQSALSQWTAQADQSVDIGALGQAMISFYAAGISDAALVTHLYFMLTGVMPSEVTVQSYVNLIGPGKTFETQGDILAYAASLPENTVHLVDLVGSIQVLDPAWFPLG